MTDKTDIKKKSNNKHDLLSREEQYKRLNEELELKTANLVKEADEVIKAQECVLFKEPRLLDNIDSKEFLSVLDNENERISIDKSDFTGSSQNYYKPREMTQHLNKNKKLSPPSSSNVAIRDSMALSIEDTIRHIYDKTDGDSNLSERQGDVVLQAASEMAPDAQIRFLKAKLRVMQEEMDKLAESCKKKDEENKKLNSRYKDIEDEKLRVQRLASGQQQQIDKYKKLSEEMTTKNETSESHLSTVKKELDNLKRSQKQQTSNQNATDVRLNRALEELAHCKDQLQKSQTSNKESADATKKKIDTLLSENKRLEKQKNELMSGFKKQLKLIDVLKRQKIHIEAAKMLSFTEEEFVKALEWGN